MHPPALAAIAGERPVASPVVRWQARRQPSVTNLRHETLRIDDPLALALLVLLDGTRTRAELATALAARLPAASARAPARGSQRTFRISRCMRCLPGEDCRGVSDWGELRRAVPRSE